MPSKPKPSSSESGVVIEGPAGKLPASERVQSLALGALPGGGPVTCQPARPSSNEVVVPSGRVTSSRKTPRFWVAQSLA
jgi:hypothetical protein